VSGHAPGDRPDDPHDLSLKRRVLRFEVSTEAFATFGEAMTKLRREAAESLDDDGALLLLARHVLGGPADEGRSSYQIALTVCEACGAGQQRGRGEQVEVGDEVVQMAECDAQHIGRIDGTSAHVGAPTRARQEVPPSVRRLVMRRDHGRCVVPGCRQHVFVDIHHLVPRSDGGEHDPDTLVVLCSAHHRALHRGQLIVEGRVSTGARFRHADGAPYGHALEPRAVAVQEEAFRALRALGFRETEVQRALERVRAKPWAAQVSKTCCGGRSPC